jgi:ATP-dependent DNA helicase RecG
MKGEEKRDIMERFSKGALPIIVSTTVVEVGVDVPEATVMVIEGAERFGLAQLHQLRGRVGRSDRPSFCFLAPSSTNPTSFARLEGFIDAKDCFDIAELDLAIRGPGDIFGSSQSGFLELKRFDPTDTQTIQNARDTASEILKKDPQLDAHPALKELVTGSKAVHLE